MQIPSFLLPDSKFHPYIKPILVVSSIIIGFSLYIVSINLFDKDLSVLNIASVDKVTIYSARTNLYKELGEIISTALAGTVNTETDAKTQGSLDNINFVNKNPHSIGICQADVYYNHPEKSDVRLIDELYNENLQILYRSNSNINDKFIHIDKIGQPNIDSIFTYSTINIGQENSGTNYMAKIFFNALTKFHPNIKIEPSNLKTLGRKDAMADFFANKIDIVFFVSGGIDDECRHAIDSSQGKLFTIDTEIIEAMNINQYKKVYKPTPIDKNKDCFTSGVPALLICNKNMPQEYINKVVKHLNEAEQSKALLSKKIANNITNVSSFLKYFIFTIALTIFSFITYLFLTFWVSSRQKLYLFGYITSVIQKNFGAIKLVKDKEKKIFEPDLSLNHYDIINDSSEGLEDLFKLRNDIGTFHNKSLLSSFNYNFLLNRSDLVINKLRKVIAIRFNELIEGDDVLVEKTTIRKFLTAELIDKEDYDWLMAKWRKNAVELGTGKYLKELIKDNLLKEAINRFLFIVENYSEHIENKENRSDFNSIIGLSARFRRNEKAKIKNIIKLSDYNIEYDKIVEALSSFIDEAIETKIIPKE